MAYEAPKTIKEVIDNIKKRHYVLPSIQREFVWKIDKIETLFDSLMQNYPIGTFLFWEVDKTKAKSFHFYEFLKKYHAKNNRHNQRFDIPENQDIIAILDGQQRLTSIYIALAGSYASRKRYARKDADTSYPPKHLYLNLLKGSDDIEKEYEFKFLTEDKAVNNDSNYWFQCSKIFDLDDMGKVSMFLMKNKLMDTSIYSEVQSGFAINALNHFFNIIHQKKIISYYLEKSEKLDKVLQIFIRINSGGTPLSYSDLLLSIATAQWQDKDAREVIHEFVDSINDIGNGFNFNKDIVLKNCLVLADFPDIRFKVDNFNKKNMSIIEQHWEKTSLSFRRAIDLVFQFGYNEKSLTATNAIIPISYFIYKNKCEDKILKHGCHEDDRKAIKEWLARVLLKGTFGGQPDSIYPGMRDLINENIGYFPLKETIDFYRGKRKSISFSDDEIDNLLEFQYENSQTYGVLSLIYPAINSSFIFHKDHIHPRSKFSKKEMKDAGVTDEQIVQFNAEMDGIANLQLLQSTENIQKGGKPFKEWLNETYKNQADRDSYLRLNHIDINQSLEFTDFLAFISARKKTIKNFLITNLGMTTEEDETA